MGDECWGKALKIQPESVNLMGAKVGKGREDAINAVVKDAGKHRGHQR